MAMKRVRYDRCIFKDADGKACKAKRLRDCPWYFCSRHETLKMVEMRAKMRDEETERQRIPLAQAIFAELCGRFAYTLTADTIGSNDAEEAAKVAFMCAEEFFNVMKDRAVG